METLESPAAALILRDPHINSRSPEPAVRRGAVVVKTAALSKINHRRFTFQLSMRRRASPQLKAGLRLLTAAKTHGFLGIGAAEMCVWCFNEARRSEASGAATLTSSEYTGRSEEEARDFLLTETQTAPAEITRM